MPLWFTPGFAAVIVVGAITSGFVAPPSQAAGDPNTLYVNSTDYYRSDAQCGFGDDSYSPTVSGNVCTLRKALETANQSTISPVTVTLATGFATAAAQAPTPPVISVSTAPTASTGGYSYPGATTGIENSNNGAFFYIARPMTVDLQNLLGASLNVSGLTGLYVNAAGTAEAPVTITGVSNFVVNQTAIAVSPTSANVTITDGKTTGTPAMRHFLAISNGAQNVTFSNYTVADLAPGDDDYCRSAMVCFTANGSTSPTQNVLIDTVLFTASASSKVANAIVFNTNAVNVNGLEIRNCTFSDLWTATAAPPVFSASSALNTAVNLANFSFHDNSIRNSGVSSASASDAYGTSIFLPWGAAPMGGRNVIEKNTFTTNSAHPVAHAIGYHGNVTTANSTALSNLTIQNNFFDGYGNGRYASIYLVYTGLVTVQYNTFGPDSYSNAGGTNSQNEATAAGFGGGMVVNDGTTANRQIRTWYPDAKEQAVTVAPATCAVTFKAYQPAAGTIPAAPVRLDVFWTATSKAERYLGSQTVGPGNTSALVTVPLPTDALGTGHPVSANGTVTGNIRLQTQWDNNGAYGQLASSQYSRYLAIAGSCLLAQVTAISPTNG
ncbi:MAG: hypothetical protein LBI33_01090, partial [Propionibacteriaceae bacterium]|nr:hypothetical protein [Propionibacteriaceae bacterium]